MSAADQKKNIICMCSCLILLHSEHKTSLSSSHFKCLGNCCLDCFWLLFITHWLLAVVTKALEIVLVISGKPIRSTTLSPLSSLFKIMECRLWKYSPTFSGTIKPVQPIPPNQGTGEVKKQAGMQKIRAICHWSSNVYFITDHGCSLQVSIPTPTPGVQ